MHSVQGPNRIQVRDQITFGLVTIAFRSMTRTCLGQGPNHTWARDQTALGSETKLNLSQKPNRIWVRDTLAFGSGIRSHLGQEPNRIWVRNQKLRGQIAFGSGTKLHLVKRPNHSGQGPNRIWAGDLFAFRSVTETFLGIYMYEFFQFSQNWCLRIFSNFFKTGAYEFFPFSKLVPTNFLYLTTPGSGTKSHLGQGSNCIRI